MSEVPTHDSLKILDVSPRSNWPPRRGSQVRTFNLMRNLSANNVVEQFSQSAASSNWHGPWLDRVPVTASYNEIRFRHPIACRISDALADTWINAPVLSGIPLSLLRPKLLRFLLKWADVIFVEFPWQFDFCWRYRENNLLVYASHNVEALKFASYAEAAKVYKGFRYWLRYIERLERSAAIRADLIMAVSEADKLQFVGRYGISDEKILVVPNGADTDRYRPHCSAARVHQRRVLGLPNCPTAIFVGGSSAAPQVIGFDWIKRLAQRVKNVTFLIVGAVSSTRYALGNLVVTGEIADHRPYLAGADFSICPIEYGGGTKIKLLEAFSSGLPTIAFAESIHGIDVRHGEHLLVVPSNIEALEAAVRHLLNDHNLRQRLGEAARAYAVRHHDWRQLAMRLERRIRPLTLRAAI